VREVDERGSISIALLFILLILVAGFLYFRAQVPERDLKIVEVTDSYIKVEFREGITPDELISFIETEVKSIIKDVKRIKEIKVDRENRTIVINFE
jgi:multidrug efflux pump subunit AcrB